MLGLIVLLVVVYGQVVLMCLCAPAPEVVSRAALCVVVSLLGVGLLDAEGCVE